jgi:hypothetical protein
VHHFFHEVITD